MARDDRVCPFCGADITLSRCDIVATNIDEDGGGLFGLDEVAESKPPSGAPVHGKRGRWPVLHRVPDEEELKAKGRKSWLSEFLAPADALTPLTTFAPEDMARRACSTCDTPLPADLDERQAHLLAVLGLSVSGKTHFLAAALSEAVRKGGLKPSGCIEFEPDEETASRLHEQYYTRLFREGQLLDTTQAEVSVRDQPLTFRVTYQGGQPFLLMTHDISGEVLSDHRRRASVTPFLRRASAVVFLIDPLEFDAVRERLPDHELPTGKRIHQTDLLAAMLRELEYAPGGCDVPVALVVSKSDIIERTFPGEYRFAQPALGAWPDDVAATSAEVKELLRQMGEDDIVAAGEKHGPTTFHAVSAIGFTPELGMPVKPRPRRCSDPLGTVLHRLDVALHS